MSKQKIECIFKTKFCCVAGVCVCVMRYMISNTTQVAGLDAEITELNCEDCVTQPVTLGKTRRDFDFYA